MRLEWTEPALDDLEALRDHIAQDSPVNAARFIERLFDATDRLSAQPRLGRKVPEADDTPEQIRELIFRGYRILYRPLSDRAQVIAVVHGARIWPGQRISPGTEAGPLNGKLGPDQLWVAQWWTPCAPMHDTRPSGPSRERQSPQFVVGCR